MKKLTEKLQARPMLCAVLVFVLYGIVGTMDYQDATRHQAVKPAAASAQ